MTAAEERRRVAERTAGIRKGFALGWSIAFFFLTSLGIVASALLFERSWFTPIACILSAELLIRVARFEGTGVESALWLGGLFTAILTIPGQGKPEALLLFALASAVAGRRVRNPIFGTLAAIFVIVYFGAKDWYAAAHVAGVAIAVAALAARAREWQRPSTDNLFAALLLASPVAGAIASTGRASILWAFAYVALAVVELAFGERKRDRVALVAGAIAIVIAFVLLREVFAFALEAKLILAGVALFGIAAAISRRLRDRSRGFVMTPVESAYEKALRIFGTAAFAPQSAHEPVQQPVGAGGSFGGAGATGDF